ncbi:MAG TPA: RidA family protein [Alphaproteobacteria bacterium]
MAENPVRRPIKVDGLADSAPYGYEQCIRVGDLVYVAGQVGVDDKYKVVSDDFSAQARQTFQNVQRALEAAGGGLPDLVSMTVFLTDIERDFKDFIAVRNQFLKAGSLPTSAAIGVSKLAFPTLKIEIQAVASIPAKR